RLLPSLSFVLMIRPPLSSTLFPYTTLFRSVLEAMTVQQAAGLSLPRPMGRGSHTAVPGPVEHAGTGDEDAARRYARLLLSEIRMYHEPIVDAARRSGDLMSRLHGEIERARKLYEARVPESVSA